MSVLENLTSRTIELRKARDPLGAFLNAVLADVKMRAKNDGNREVTEEDAVVTVRKALKDNAEAQRLSVSRADAITELTAKAALLETLLPKSIEKDAVLSVAIETLGTQPKSPKVIGQIMGALKAKFGTDLDPASASAWVREWLNQ